MNEKDQPPDTPEKCKTCTDSNCPSHSAFELTPENKAQIVARFVVGTYLEIFAPVVDMHTFIDGALEVMALSEPANTLVKDEIYALTRQIAQKGGH